MHRLTAQSLYEAYGKSSNWLNYRGRRMPHWSMLPEDIRNHWESVARYVRSYIVPELGRH